MSEEVYDLETFPNVFTATFCDLHSDAMVTYEISDRRQDNYALYHHVAQCKRMYGFNNMGFDWPILFWFMQHPNATAAQLYERCQLIIGAEDRFEHTIWNPVIEQVDVFLMHHFNNPAKSTSLKKLQFNMRSELVQDLPFPVGTFLDFAQIDVLINYNQHDVLETKKFVILSKDKIEHRMQLNPKWINQSDTGLGRKFFEQELEKMGIDCYEQDPVTGRRKPKGTYYLDGVKLSDVLFPYLRFRQPVLIKALSDFKDCTITEHVLPSGKIKRLGAPDEYTFDLGGLEAVMGLGGGHASMSKMVIEGHDIVDLDVTGFYPRISVVNRIHPKHLGPGFCDLMELLAAERATLSKKTPRAKAIKDGMNSVFGSSGTPFTCFYDPGYMLGTTMNGQFLIFSLAELLLTVPGVQLIQVNTDGLTFICPPGKRAQCTDLWQLWSKHTRMQLEMAEYSKMFIRDVNNYVAVYTDGRVKLKGAYEPERQWHQNHSMPIVRRAALSAMLDGVDPEDFISANDSNSWDFLLRLDLSRQSHLLLDNQEKLSGVVRYYVSETGNAGTKYMTATKTRIHAKGWAERTGKKGAWTCSACDAVHKTVAQWDLHADTEHSSKLRIAQRFDGGPIEYDMRFYASEAKKLIITEKFEYGKETKKRGKAGIRRPKSTVAEADAGQTEAG